jgi:ABC-type spermidine/putrescine transport system permease subunit II
MELLAGVLSIVLAALAGTLGSLALMASQRFHERRFFLIGSAFLVMMVTAVLAALAEFDVFATSWYDESFALEPVPLALLIVTVVLVYGAMGGRHRPAGSSRDGGP